MSGVWPKRVRTTGKEMWSGRTERPYGGSLSERLHALRHGDTTWPRVKEWIDPPPPSPAWWASRRFPWRIDIIPKADHMNEGMMCVGAWVCESRRVSKEDLMGHQRCDVSIIGTLVYRRRHHQNHTNQQEGLHAINSGQRWSVG